MNLPNRLSLSILVFLFYIGSIYGQIQYSDVSDKEKSSILQEQFNSNANKWITDNSWIKGEISNGKLTFSCKNIQQTGLNYISVPIDQSRDYEIEASITMVKGIGSLIFGLADNFDHYMVELSGKNICTVKKDTPSKRKLEKLFSGSFPAGSQNDSHNKITARKSGTALYIFVNETYIGSIDDILLKGNKTGFEVEPNSEMSVDYINVSYVDEKIIQKIADNVPAKDSELINSQGDQPVIKWTSPSSERTSYTDYSARVKAVVTSISELTSVVFYINGTSTGEAEWQLVQGNPQNYTLEKTINFEPGENVVYFTATSKTGSIKSPERYFTIPGATKPVITWNIPATTNVSVDQERLNIEVCINSPSGLKSVKVVVNGEMLGGDNVFRESAIDNCKFKWQYPVILKEGIDNSIVVYAENVAGSIPSESRIVRYSKAIVEKRIALVIGNSDYGTKTPLKNPVQDANLMEATLKGLGFTVEKCLNLTLDSLKSVIREFSQTMKSNKVALFYYAGHGIQVDGSNYLIPVDAKLINKDDVEWEAFAVDDLLDQFRKNPDNINIAILDACRSNPFTSWVRGNEAAFMPLTNTSGMFISFATGPGSTAADGSSGNGLFTEELVKQMNVPQPITSVFQKTRTSVWERSNKTQRPQEWNDLNGEFFFKK